MPSYNGGAGPLPSTTKRRGGRPTKVVATPGRPPGPTPEERDPPHVHGRGPTLPRKGSRGRRGRPLSTRRTRTLRDRNPCLVKVVNNNKMSGLGIFYLQSSTDGSALSHKRARPLPRRVGTLREGRGGYDREIFPSTGVSQVCLTGGLLPLKTGREDTDALEWVGSSLHVSPI